MVNHSEMKLGLRNKRNFIPMGSEWISSMAQNMIQKELIYKETLQEVKLTCRLNAISELFQAFDLNFGFV